MQENNDDLEEEGESNEWTQARKLTFVQTHWNQMQKGEATFYHCLHVITLKSEYVMAD